MEEDHIESLLSLPFLESVPFRSQTDENGDTERLLLLERLLGLFFSPEDVHQLLSQDEKNGHSSHAHVKDSNETFSDGESKEIESGDLSVEGEGAPVVGDHHGMSLSSGDVVRRRFFSSNISF